MGPPWAFFTGTSMATPHIAGGAAVLLQLHDDWSPAQIKSALVNHADLVVKDAVTGTHDVGPTLQGGGRREPFRSRGRNDMDGSGFGELRPCDRWSSDFGHHHTKQPDRHRSDVQRLDDKVYAGHFRRNGPEYMECWNLQRGRSRDHCPGQRNGTG